MTELDLPPRGCKVCAILKICARIVSSGLTHLADILDTFSCESVPLLTGDDEDGLQSAWYPREQHSTAPQLKSRRSADPAADHEGMFCVASGSSSSSKESAGRRYRSGSQCLSALSQGAEQMLSENVCRNAFTDLQIEIPIVKPPSWSKVMPLVEGCAMTFDERGVKETMTVRTSRWSDFVDRQKTKLELEIQDVRSLIARRAEEGNLSDWDREGAVSMADQDEEDIEELVQLVSRMDDWKDLCRYSGKSISMASTKYGNEMKIHVMAFAERDDATGVDFMRVSYKKSVEVQRSPMFDVGNQSGWSSTLRMVLPFLWSPTHTDADKAKEQWVQLLQRPDVAKFTIALAFRAALANDGVFLKFCEAGFNDAADL